MAGGGTARGFVLRDKALGCRVRSGVEGAGYLVYGLGSGVGSGVEV